MGRVSQALLLLVLPCLFAVVSAEEEEKASDVSVGMAATLIGSISFQMLIYYLVNHRDKDMKRYSYETLSATISIFCAVLLFQSVNDILEQHVLEGLPLHLQAAVDLVHMVIWFAILQLCLAYISGAITDQKPKDIREMECDMKCFAVLLAHITGFAAINCFGTIQHFTIFKGTWLRALGVLPLAVFILYILQRVTDTVRDKVAESDGIKDEFEEMWDEQVEEAEDDVTGLAISFLLVQSIRFLIGGNLPNEEGEESEEFLHGHSGMEVLTLCGVGLMFVLLLAIVEYGLLNAEEKEQEEEAEGKENSRSEEVLERAYENLVIALSMSMAWCFFFSVRWILASYYYTGLDDPMVLALTVALCVSLASFGSIRALDIAADSDYTGEKADEILKIIINAIGILVGFAWEQCFDTAVGAIASRTANPSSIKFALALFCTVLIVPAWRFYMLPMVVKEGWRYGFLLQDKHHLAELQAEMEEQEKERERKEQLKEKKKNEATPKQGQLSKPLLA